MKYFYSRLFRALAVSAIAVSTAAAVERPPITDVANIAVKVENLEEARKFYNGVVGLAEAFTTKDERHGNPMTCFKINDKQYVEVSPVLKSETEDRLIRIGFETADAKKLRDYLASKGVTVPAKVTKDPNGNLSFIVKDPDDHAVQFIQYLNGSVHMKNKGKHMPATRISDHILHVGIRVTDPERADKFYKDILGFRLLWKGGNTDTRFEWISMLVPNGHTWVEYMVYPGTFTPQQLGTWHHVCLGTQDIQQVYKTVTDRGYKSPRGGPVIARDGRWLLHLFDKNYTRTEIMIRKPARKPCCSELTDDNI